MLRTAGLNGQVLTYRSLEALSDIANSAANKIFIPTRVVETLDRIGAIGDMLKETKKITEPPREIDGQVYKLCLIPYAPCTIRRGDNGLNRGSRFIVPFMKAGRV